MNNNETTVPHMILEQFPHIGEAIEIPDEVKGDLTAEHNFLFPIIMKEYKKEWAIVCEEVDKGIEAGTLVFNGETGTITKV